MRKLIKQMVERHYRGIKFANLKECLQANQVWQWQNEGLIAISTASANEEYAELAYINGLKDGEYMLTEV